MEGIVEKLKFAGIQGKVTGNEYKGKCPFCGKPKFYVNIKSGKYICFSGSCRRKGHISSILGEYKVDFDEVFSKSLFYEKNGVETYIEHDINELNNYKYIHRYMLDRGFDKDFLAANKVGYDKKTHRITVPIFFDQKYWGCIKRTVLPDVEAKYIYPPNMPKRELVYLPYVCEAPGGSKWIDKNKKVLLIVEGSLDALKAAQYGYRAMAVLGCFITNEQMSLIEQYAKTHDLEIVLMFDNDEAGKKAIQETLSKYFWVDFKVGYIAEAEEYANSKRTERKIVDNQGKICYNDCKGEVRKDVGDLSPEELDYVISRAKDRFDVILDELFSLTEF